MVLNPIAVIFWDNVDRYRREQELSWHELDKKAGVNKSYCFDSKRHKALPRAKVIERITEALGVSYVYLFEDWTEEE